MEKEVKEKKISGTNLYIMVIENQIKYCNENPSNYGILYDKGFKDGLLKAIDILIKVREEVKKNETRK